MRTEHSTRLSKPRPNQPVNEGLLLGRRVPTGPRPLSQEMVGYDPTMHRTQPPHCRPRQAVAIACRSHSLHDRTRSYRGKVTCTGNGLGHIKRVAPAKLSRSDCTEM